MASSSECRSIGWKLWPTVFFFTGWPLYFYSTSTVFFIYLSVCLLFCLFVCMSVFLSLQSVSSSLSLLSTCLFIVFLNFHLCSAFYSKCMSAYLLTFSCLFLSLRSLFYLHQLFLDSYLFLDSSAFNFLPFSFSLFLYLAILDNLFISLPRHTICWFLSACSLIYVLLSIKWAAVKLKICFEGFKFVSIEFS